MGIIFLLIGFSFIIALIFLAAFLWSVRGGQFEDTYTPGIRILFDEESLTESNGTKQPKQ